MVRLTKYSGLALIAVSVLAVVILNVIASYSNSKIQAGAESPATLATNVSGEASISLSIHSATDSCDTSASDNPAGDICMQIPDGGGLAVGRHTLSVTSNSYAGYFVTVEGSGSSTDMAAPDFGSGTSSNNELIKSTTATIANPSTLNLNTWGIAIPGKENYSDESTYELGITNPNDDSTQSALAKATFGAVPPKLAGETIMSSNQATGTNHDGSSPDNQTIYYGANVEQFFRAGTYSEEVVYTATANLPATPSNLAITPNQYEADGCSTPDVTVTGTNLESAYSVYIDLNNNGKLDTNLTPADLGTGSASEGTISEQCTNLDVVTSGGQTSLTCTMPRSSYIPNSQTYDVYILTQATEPGILADAYSYTKPATGISVKSTSENIIVDYDENLIPVVYVGYNGNGGGHWESLTKSEIASNTDNWFNYANKQWANAVTVTKDSLSKYQDKHTAIDNNDVLGYWVYIPRYAYEVQRRDAVDRVVDPQNFDIVFQTADEKNTPAPTCNSADSVWVDGTPVKNAGSDSVNILSKDYRTGCWPNNRTYVANSSNTTWATHPAFTWGDTELNGLWVGKFETTGKVNAPTVKPNQHANISEYIGSFYLAAKSIGKEDKCNVGGGSSATDTTGRPTLEDDLVPNSHNLQTTKSHMLKNGEWGAVAYLSASKYGAGVNGTQINSAYPTSSADADGTSSRYGITGCGPNNASGSALAYTDGTALSADLVESPTACSQTTAKAYNGSIGVLASTTNTVYGIYDMSGGAYEYVMGNLTGYDDQSETSSSSYMTTQAKPPYVDLYKESPYGNFGEQPDWSYSTSNQYYNNDVCTWATCGGHALHETKQYQSVSCTDQSWGGDYSRFVSSSSRWFQRGGSASSGSNAGLFYSGTSSGSSYSYSGFRSALLALPQG